MPIIFKLYVGRETLITFAMLFGMMLVTGLCLVILGLIYPHMKYFEYTEYSYYLIVSKMFEVLIGMVLAQLLIIVNQHFAWKKYKGNQEKNWTGGTCLLKEIISRIIPEVLEVISCLYILVL